MQDESTSGESARQYAELVKVGDALTTPDGEVWIVERVTGTSYEVVSAERGDDGQVYEDRYDAARTVLPAALTSKVADARRVRRS